jgi:hypothetical protein
MKELLKFGKKIRKKGYKLNLEERNFMRVLILQIFDLKK